MENCLICDRIKLIEKDLNPAFVMELETGYVVFGDHQFYRGYTLLLCKLHKCELYELQPDFRKQFLWEMSVVAEAVARVFKPVKMNYELLGNADAHMHWHLYPRHSDDPDPKRPVWVFPKEKKSKGFEIDNNFISQYKPLLKASLEEVGR